MRRTLLLMVILAVLGLVSYRASLAYQMNNNRTPRKPMVLLQVERSSRGGHVFEKLRTLAISSDGSTAQIPASGGNANSEFDERLLTLTASGSQIQLVDKLQLKTSIPLSAQRVKAMRYSQAAPKCEDRNTVARSFTGEDVLLDFVVYKYTRSEKTQNGDLYVFETWLAPDLDCTPLKQTMELTEHDGQRVFVEKVIQSVTLGEPDRALFEVPSVYQEVPPSVLERSVVQANRPGHLPEQVEQTSSYGTSNIIVCEAGRTSNKRVGSGGMTASSLILVHLRPSVNMQVAQKQQAPRGFAEAI